MVFLLTTYTVDLIRKSQYNSHVIRMGSVLLFIVPYITELCQTQTLTVNAVVDNHDGLCEGRIYNYTVGG